MGVLFIGAMALIFYILLLRAQHLGSMERQRENPEPEARVERIDTAHLYPPAVLLQTEENSPLIPHELRYESAAI
jgi:hypothetical protein